MQKRTYISACRVNENKFNNKPHYKRTLYQLLSVHTAAEQESRRTLATMTPTGWFTLFFFKHFVFSSSLNDQCSFRELCGLSTDICFLMTQTSPLLAVHVETRSWIQSSSLDPASMSLRLPTDVGSPLHHNPSSLVTHFLSAREQFFSNACMLSCAVVLH